MAIVRDASSPATVLTTYSSVNVQAGTTAAFNPPANSLLVLSLCVDCGTATPTLTGPTNTGTALTWTKIAQNLTTSGGVVVYEAFNASAQTGITVTAGASAVATGNATGNASGFYLDVWTGANATQTSAATPTTGNSATSPFNLSQVNAVDQSQTVGIFIDDNGSGAPTTTDTGIGFISGTNTGGIRAYKSAVNTGTGNTVTVNAARAGPAFHGIVYEIVPASGAPASAVCGFLVAAPLFMQLVGSATYFQSVVVPPPPPPSVKLGTYVNQAPQPFDLLRIAPQIETPNFNPQGSLIPEIESEPERMWPLVSQYSQPLRVVVSTTGKLGAYQNTGPQPFNLLSIQPQTETPTFNPQGYLLPQVESAPEPPWPVTAQYSRPVKAAVVTSGKLATFQYSGPQPFALLSIQPVTETPTFSPQGYLMPQQDAAPQTLWELAPQSFPTVRTSTPPAPTVRSFVGAPAQMDLVLPARTWRTLFTPLSGSSLTGVSATGSVGSVQANLTITLSGVSATGSVGTVTPFAGTLIQLTGVSATGSVGSVSLIKLLIPNVVDIPLGLAGVLLNNSSFQVGPLSYQHSTTIALGSVIAQNPIAGTEEFENTPVSLLISSGFVSPTNNPVTGIHLPNLPNKILPPDNQLVDERGVMKTNWWRFLLNVSNQAMGTNQTVPATVTIGASPYVFVTPAQGTLLVSGGPVTLIEYSKDGVTWYPTGLTQGQIQMVPNDQVRITYMNPPTLTFFPR